MTFPIPPAAPAEFDSESNVVAQDVTSTTGSSPATTTDEPATAPAVVPELGGRRDGTDPTRFGDWEKGGRCIDF